MIDTTIILNVMLGMLAYNILIKWIGAVMFKHFMNAVLNTETGKQKTEEVRKSFQERLAENREEQKRKNNEV